MTITELLTPAATDSPISISSAAAALTITEATTRRYLRAGKLTRLDGGVSAASVEAYAERRAANISRTRTVPGWHRRPTGDLHSLPRTAGPVEEAAAAWAEAARLEALARKLKAKARPVLEEAGPGTYGPFEVRFTEGRLDPDTKLIAALYFAVFGEDVPRKRSAPSPKVSPAA
ncbi:hypothetical protein [Frankia sp. R82]|uniref:hypothetical protein n=1 Tax=Frankia sp. R82 TaxID=2950553 RepID=UPI002042FC0B|nr:hypothetical protein [Frankia sp. R82]MCM3886146.1 hypothetical protein [Frankia sp. R82]